MWRIIEETCFGPVIFGREKRKMETGYKVLLWISVGFPATMQPSHRTMFGRRISRAFRWRGGMYLTAVIGWMVVCISKQVRINLVVCVWHRCFRTGESLRFPSSISNDSHDPCRCWESRQTLGSRKMDVPFCDSPIYREQIPFVHI